MIFISYYLIQVLYILGFTYYLQSELIINLSSLLPLIYFWVNDHYYNEITIFNMFYWYVIADIYIFIFHYLSHTTFGMKYIHYINHSISDIIIYRYIPDIFAYIISYCLKKYGFSKHLFESYNKTDIVFISTMCFNGYGHLTRSEEIIKVIKKKCILIIITKSSRIDQIKKITSNWLIPIEYIILDFDFNGSIYNSKNNYLYKIFNSLNEGRQLVIKRYQDIYFKYGIPKILITNQDCISTNIILFEKHIAISSHFRLLSDNIYLSPKIRFFSKCNYLLHKFKETNIIIPYDIGNKSYIQTNNLLNKYEFISRNVLIYWTECIELLDLSQYIEFEYKLITREKNISHFDFINELKKCDIFITSGGFESIIEALLLNKKVITFALQLNNEEQYWSSKLLSSKYPNSVKHITHFNKKIIFDNKTDYDKIITDRNEYHYNLERCVF